MTTRAPANERCLLGSILLLGAIPPSVEIWEHWLSDPRHQAVLGAMRAIQERCEALDHATIEAELERRGELQLCGGLSGIAEICDSGCTRTLAHYALVVKEAARRRRIAHLARVLIEQCEGPGEIEGAYGSLVHEWDKWE
jgi:replicative DNA helicase